MSVSNLLGQRRNAVLGITASPQEYEAYVTLAINRPDVPCFYTAIFGDIYLLNEKLLPTFDVVTLFHLCEFRGEQNDAYGAMTDLEITRLLTSKTRLGGHILFYPSSFAFDRAGHSSKDLIAQWEQGCQVERVRMFGSLWSTGSMRIDSYYEDKLPKSSLSQPSRGLVWWP